MGSGFAVSAVFAIAALGATLTLAAPPPDIGNELKIVKSGARAPSLSWLGVAGATSYDVRRCEPPPARSCTPATLASAAVASYGDASAVGLPYAWYLIASRNSCGATPADPSDPVPLCGNGVLEGCEECDDGGTMSGDGCDASCLDEGTPMCGDGILQAGEECDDGAANSDTDPDACRTTCVAAGCGDSVVDYARGEGCDDGGTMAGDGCDASCAIEAPPGCGDGLLDIAAGEECDDGGLIDGDGCSATCQLETLGAGCGNSRSDPLEVCDDGNLLNGDGCNPTCDLTNTTTLFAGSPGMPGRLDGIGTAARFGGNGSLAIDATAIWVADAANQVIRRIDIATADVVTVAGTGTAGYLDDAMGTRAQFMGPGSIATDGRTVWIGDGGNHRIRAMSATPPYAVTTVAGSGAIAHTDGIGPAAAFDDLRGLTFYGGFVYLLDANGATLRRFDPTTNRVVTLAGTPYATGRTDGFGAGARFISPRYMASDNSGMLYIADTNGNTVRSFNSVTTYVGTFAGSGVAGYVDAVGTLAQIHRPRGMTADGTSVYFVEFEQDTVRQGVFATRSITTNIGRHCGGATPCAGSYAEGVGTAALLNGPFDLAFHFPSRSIFLFDGGNNVIRRLR